MKFVGAAIDPDGASPITDTDLAAAFLRQLGLTPTMENVERVIDLREAARRFA